ncbi:TPM domain-containing protein [Sphingobacterium kyonggiense]
MKNYLLIILFLLSFQIHNAYAQEIETKPKTEQNNKTLTFPEQIGYVNDFAKVFDSLKVVSLNEKLKNFDKQTTNQIVVVSINDDKLNQDNFDDYVIDLSNHWGVGTAEKNNGLTFVFSPKLRRMRITTGLGTQEIITDEICAEIIKNIIIPEFKKEKYFEGITKGVDECIRLWNEAEQK